MKQTSQRSLLFRQNVNRTEAEWVHFLDGYRKALIEFDMKKFGDDWHTAEDIVEGRQGDTPMALVFLTGKPQYFAR